MKKELSKLDKKTIINFGNWLISKNEEAYKTIESITKERDLNIEKKGILKESIQLFLISHESENQTISLDGFKLIPKDFDKYKGLVSLSSLEKIRVALLNIECNFDFEKHNELKLYDRLEEVDNFKDFIYEVGMKFEEITNNLEPYHFNIMLDTLQEIQYFIKSRIDENNTNYRQEIEQLKKKADYLQYFSEEQIKIKIPIQPYPSRLFMYAILKRDGLTKKRISILDNFLRIILDKKRLPKIHDSEIEIIFKSRISEKHYKPTKKD